MNVSPLTGGIGGLLDRAASRDPDSILAVLRQPQTIQALVETIDEASVGVPIRLLARETALKRVMEDFTVASVVADHEIENRLHLRVTEDIGESALLLGEDVVIALITLDKSVCGLPATDEEFLVAVREEYTARWEGAEDFSHRTPPRSRVQATLRDEIGHEVESDFEAMLTSLETVRADGDPVDEVVVSLLAAARNEALLYDISKWGEDVGVASKATFSRTKTHLEDVGLITTEKVPIDVGRPRLRLMLGDDRLKTADPSELVNVAISTAK